MLEASVQTGLAFRFAPEELRADGEFVLEVARRSVYGKTLLACTFGRKTKLTCFRQVWLAPVQLLTWRLHQKFYAQMPPLFWQRYAPRPFYRAFSHELIQISRVQVRLDGAALEYASDALRADRTVVIAAVRLQPNFSLVWASDS